MNDPKKRVQIFERLLDRIFEHKELPYYSAERRLDPIFGLFIEDILFGKYGEQFAIIIPEFPIRPIKKTKSEAGEGKIEDKEEFTSNEVDYLCVNLSTKTLLFVELKTDAKSYRIEQLLNYIDNSNWERTVHFLTNKANAKSVSSNDRIKYYNLVKHLIKYGVVTTNMSSLIPSIDKLLNSDDHANKMERTTLIKKLITSIKAEPLFIKILYIGPKEEQFAVMVEKIKALQYKSITTIDFIPLEKLKTMNIITEYPAEWSMLSNKF